MAKFTLRFAAGFLLLVGLLLGSAPAFALTGASVSSTLTSSNIQPGGKTTVIVTVTNPNNSTLAVIGNFTTLPSGVNFASPNNLSSNCPASTNPNFGGNNLQISNGTSFGPTTFQLAPNASCTYQVDVTAPGAGIFSIFTNYANTTDFSTNPQTVITGTNQYSTNLYVSVPPVVSSISPTSGPTAGGTSVTITGMNFTGTTGTGGVKFGANNATSYTVNTDTQITAVAPAGSAGTIDVTVTNGSTSATSANSKYTYAAPPTISAAFSPTSISSAPGSPSTSTLTLTISNTNASTALSGVAVAANALPANLTGSGQATSCTGGTASYSAGAGLGLSGGSLNASSSCTVTLTVSSSVAGNYSYTTGTVSSSSPATTGTTATTPTPLTVTKPTATQAVATKVLTQNALASPFTPVTGSGGVAPLGYSILPSLPTGLSFNTGNGQITGTPTVTLAASNFTVTVTDANGATDSKQFSLTVNSAVTATQAVASKSLTQNTSTSFTPVTGGGGTGSLTYGVSPSLPNGLSFSTSTGQITGSPTVTSGSQSYAVTVTDTNGATAQNTFSLTVNSAVTATQAVPTKVLTQNTAASFTPVTGGGGTAPLTYGVSPSLPSGLSFNTGNGQITGAPTVTHASSNFTVTVTDANGSSASNTFSLTVNGAVTATQAVASKTLTQNTAAAPFTPVTGGGGTAPLSYSVSPTLPNGLSLTTTNGQITGTPTVTSGAQSYTVTVTDVNGATATNSFSLTVNGPVVATQAVATKVLTQNTAAAPFTPVTGGGGTAPLSYGVSPTLPNGLSFSTTNGQITGTPTVASVATNYTVTVTDVNGGTATNSFSLTVNGAVTATQAVATKVLTQNTAAAPFTPVTGGGGTSPLTYGVSPALPTGLSFNTGTGQITGTPTVTLAATNFTVTVTDANGGTANNAFNLTVNGAVTATQAVASKVLTANMAAAPFTPVTGGGGTSPLAYSVSPALPNGLSFNTGNGQITGTPTAASATTTYTVTVTDANGGTASAGFSLTVNGPIAATQAIASKTLTVNTAAAPFTPVTGAGGTSPLAYGVSPALPAGLSFNTGNGQITGTPTVTSAAANYTVTVTDANGGTASNTFSLAVNGAVVATQAVASKVLTQNAAATPFTPVTGSGGTAPLTYGVSPSLPTGLTLNTANGQVTGTPTVASAAANYTVTVTDANGATATNTFNLTVNGAVTATQAMATKTLTVNTAATPFTPVTASGGTAPLSYGVSPALPAGLSFNTGNGQITGTPTVASAAANYTVTVTDANGATATAGFSLAVNGAVTATQAVASRVLTVNRAATPFTPVTGSGGTSPLSYSVAPTLPAGLTFAPATGQIAGTPTATIAATSFTVTVTDANGATATNTFSLMVNPAVTATQAVPSTVLTVNRAATPFTPVTASGGTAPLSYAVAPALPAGLSFAAATGQVTGTATAASATTTYTVTATDANGASASATFSLTVNGAVTATQAVASTTLTVNQPATPFTPVTGSGGTAPLSFSVAPALPVGLSVAAANGQITGTPTVVSPATTYTVTVTDANGATAAATFSLAVTATPSPTVTAVSPGSGPAAGGTSVTITGTNFTGATSVTIGGTAATAVTIVNATTITATTPAHAAGAVSVQVTTPGGSNAANTLYTYTAAPTVTAINPVSGPTAGGTTIAITGTNLTGATSVTLGGVAATNVVVASASTITATSPAHAAGVVDVVVTTPGGTATGTGLYTYTAAPTVTAISPNNGPVAGGTAVTVTGTNFTGATSVTIGGTAATAVSVVNATTITATTPAHAAGVVDVVVTTPGGTAAGTGLYTYTAAPTVTAVAPNTGPGSGGTAVTIAGTNFTGATGVTLGGVAATNVVVANASTITATTPAHAAGAVDVVVTGPGGTATGAGLYTYAVPATTTALASSRNPSAVGQAVTFTATVSSNGGVPAGSVVFNDGGTALGTSTVTAGVATLTTSTLTLGTHSITAVFTGNGSFSGSTSPALQQAVSTPLDSLNLRALQIAATQVIAQTSGAAITGAIDTAISEAFSGGGNFVTPSGNGMRFNFSADPDQTDTASGPTFSNTVNDQRLAMSGGGDLDRSRGSGGRSRTNDAFAAIDRNAPNAKAPPLRSFEPPDWLLWAQVSGTGISRWASATTALSPLYGNQVNALLGLTRRVSETFVIGAAGGYETFDYRSDTLNGHLKGDGWTIGSYLGWKFAGGLRFDAAAAYSGIGYDGTSGAANGAFSGHRWLLSSGLIGNTKLYGFDIEPSAKIYALWEKEDAYVDSLGTPQADRTFFTGRASAGVKVAYPWLYSATVAISPFAGVYADYYFTGDNAAVVALAGAVPLASTPLLDGWSARAVGGVAARFASGPALAVGAEFGGIGSNTKIWTFRSRASLPFSAQ